MTAPRNVPVDDLMVSFPYQPYPEQLNFMRDLLKCLKCGSNCALEAPTGFGKTLCLTSVVLSYQHALRTIMTAFHDNITEETGELEFEGKLHSFFSDEEQMWSFLESCSEFDRFKGPAGSFALTSDCNIAIPRLIYTSRTHEELQQVREAIAKIELPCSLAYLGSREHFCANQEVIQTDRGIAFECKYFCKHGACALNNESLIQSVLPEIELQESTRVWDIEDFKAFCNRSSICPYYTTSAYARMAQIVVSPYNYVFNAACPLSGLLENAIIVVDEAHNLPGVCTSQFERNFTFESIDELLAGLVSFEVFASASGEFHEQPIDVKPLSLMLFALHGNLEKMASCSSFDRVYRQDQYFTHEVSQLFAVNGKDEAAFCDVDGLEAAEEVVEEIEFQFMTNERLRSHTKEIPDIGLLAYFLDLQKEAQQHANHLKILVTQLENTLKPVENESYAGLKTPVAMQKVMSLRQSAQAYDRVEFRVICLSPEPMICDLSRRQFKQIILTSGTLSPLQTVEKEFGIPLHFKHSYRQIADSEYAHIIVSLDDNKLLGTFENRTEPSYIAAINEILRQTCVKLVSGGVLAFFTSYTVMEQFHSRFQAGETLIFREEKQQQQTVAQINKFKIATSTSTAIFFAVLKGRLSEGADFPDNCCRAVIIVSLPFAPARDPVVIEKAKHCREEYEIDAIRAVSQAAGRAVRHSNDFGAVLLVDQRFYRMKSLLPQWAFNAKICDFKEVSFEELNHRIVENIPQVTTKLPSRESLNAAAKSFVTKSPAEKLAVRRALFARLSDHQRTVFRTLWRIGCGAAQNDSPADFVQIWLKERVNFNSEQEGMILSLFCEKIAALAQRNFD